MLLISPAGLLFRYLKKPWRERKNIRIFLLRGGLGNQLFQIAGAAYWSMKYDFDVIFCDSDVKNNPRDIELGSILELDFDLWFDEKVRAYKSSSLTNLLIRILQSKKLPFMPLYFAQNDIDDYCPTRKLGFIQGYFQNSRFVCSLPQSEVIQTFKNLQPKETNRGSIAIHIRATDALMRKEMFLDLAYYQNALRLLHAIPANRIDVYSDDLDYARVLCSKIENLTFNFPEQALTLSPIDLLVEISSYDKIVSSKSTLCWWACYLSISRNPSSVIISPWDKVLHLSAWHEVGKK
jgi:hypothetical protein